MLMKLLLKTMTAILSPGKHLMRQQRCTAYLPVLSYRTVTASLTKSDGISRTATEGCQQADGKVWRYGYHPPRGAWGVYNPTTGTVSETTTDTSVRGVLEDVNLREVNDLIQAGDKRLLIAAADIANPPTTADEAIIEGITYQTVQVRTIEQDNTAITYELILRA
jgi:hypothetical protein